MLYGAYQAQIDAVAPVKALAKFFAGALHRLPGPLRDDPVVRWVSATNELVARARLTHHRPPFGIDTVRVDGEPVGVRQEVVADHAVRLAPALRQGQRRSSSPRCCSSPPWPGTSPPCSAPPSGPLGATTTSTSPTGTTPATSRSRRAPSASTTTSTTSWRSSRRIGPGVHVLAVCQPCPATLAAASPRWPRTDDPATARRA